MNSKSITLLVACFALLCMSTQCRKENPPTGWENFNYPEVVFTNKAEGTEGWRIYERIIPNPEVFIQEHALRVAQTLYFSDKDPNIPDIQKIIYDFENKDGISAKAGDPPTIHIFYSSRWVEQIYNRDGEEATLYETRGVLYHELVHGYQAQPRGCGVYADGPKYEFWIFTEGLADAVRFHHGFFPESDRRPGGSWRDGYRRTGYFLQWLTTKDPDFLRKFNKTGVDFDVWSFDAAMQYIFGADVTTDKLWEEYQDFLIALQPSN